MTDAPNQKSSKADLIMLAHVGVVVIGLAIAIQLAACQKEQAAPPPKPSAKLVQAMLEYCKIGELPRANQREAQKVWGFQNGGDPEVGSIWNRAARDKQPGAILLVRAAATAAMGGDDKCPILDVLDHPERLPPKDPPTPPAGSAAP